MRRTLADRKAAARPGRVTPAEPEPEPEPEPVKAEDQKPRKPRKRTEKKAEEER